MSEKTETERIGDLEAWAFRAGRDLADIKNRVDRTATVASVDSLHQDMRELRDEVRVGFDGVGARFDAIDGRLDALDGRLDAQQSLLEQILNRLPAQP